MMRPWETTESRFMELPTDLILAIFFRLECRDIMRCRSVCRAWNDLLSDSNFSSNYSRHSPLTTFLVTRYRRSDCCSIIQVAANGEFIRRPIKLAVPKSSKERSIMEVIGSCEGLVFFSQTVFNFLRVSKTEQVYFCNPLLGECLSLIKLRINNVSLDRVEYKLGFVPSNNKIKLLRIGFDHDDSVKKTHILTFREDDKWRELKDPLTLLAPCRDETRFNGICLNGAYHWVAEDENVDWICTFDFGEEKCGRISKPLDLLQLSSKTRMTVLNNHLCLIDCTNPSLEMTIWTMKEYGVAESWSRDILLRKWFPYPDLSHVFPFAILPSGNILFFELEYGLLCFSLKTKRCTGVRFRSQPVIKDALCATTYAPRFYSLEEDVSGRKR